MISKLTKAIICIIARQVQLPGKMILFLCDTALNINFKQCLHSEWWSLTCGGLVCIFFTSLIQINVLYARTTQQFGCDRLCPYADVTTLELRTHINEKMSPHTEVPSLETSRVQRVKSAINNTL